MTATRLADPTDRAIVNLLQDGMPVCERPYAESARELGLSEQMLLERLESLLEAGVLTRLGPMFDVERLGGAFTLCAMRVPRERFDEAAAVVNAFHEVAHNYEREHAYNMWFVIGADSRARALEVVDAIERATGIDVLELPKLEEYYVGLRLEA